MDRALRASLPGSTLLARVDFANGVPSPGSVSFHIGAERKVILDFALVGAPVVVWGDERLELDAALQPAARSKTLRSVELFADGGHLVVAMRYDPIALHCNIRFDEPVVPEVVTVAVDPSWAGVESVGDDAEINLSVPTALSLPGPGWSLAWPGPSQIGQDQWVVDVLGMAQDGYFVEIGGDDGVTNSNTLALEEWLGWPGLIVEANPRLAEAIRRRRSATVVETAVYSTSGLTLQFVDSGALGGLVDTLQDDVHARRRQRDVAEGRLLSVRTVSGSDLFAEAGVPEFIDYLSVDTEGSEAEVVASIDFERWRVALITVEHAGLELKRARLARILEPLGYQRCRAWFEDWYWHPDLVAYRLGVTRDEAAARVGAALTRVPLFRSELLRERLQKARAVGDHALARRLLFEGAKPFYPNNAHLVLGTARLLRADGASDMAMALLEKQEAQAPILQELARLYGEGHFPDRLFRVAERWLDLDPAAATHPVLVQAMRSLIPVRPEVMGNLLGANHPPRAFELLLSVAADAGVEMPELEAGPAE